jgi:hypothetical protein
LSDSSRGKIVSHHKLLAYTKKFGEKAITSAYVKKQLQTLCKAYDVKYNSRTTKQNLTKEMVVAMMKNESIPCPHHVNNVGNQS